MIKVTRDIYGFTKIDCGDGGYLFPPTTPIKFTKMVIRELREEAAIKKEVKKT